MNQQQIDECLELWMADIPKILSGKPALEGQDVVTVPVYLSLTQWQYQWVLSAARSRDVDPKQIVRECIDKCRQDSAM
tara:strand:+ start:400 stop:633 length:234 start_codon:yes stop_codon:yes gene_type:complete